MNMKWLFSILATVILLVMAFIILAPLISPVGNINYVYAQDGKVSHVEFDYRAEGIPVLWLNGNPVLCEVYDNQHARCEVNLLPKDIRKMEIEIVP